MALGVYGCRSIGPQSLDIEVIVYFLDNGLRSLCCDVLRPGGADESVVPAACDVVFLLGLGQVGPVVGMHFPAPLRFLYIAQLAKLFFNALQRRHAECFSGVELRSADVGGTFAVSLRLFADDFVDD